MACISIICADRGASSDSTVASASADLMFGQNAAQKKKDAITYSPPTYTAVRAGQEEGNCINPYIG